MWSDKTGQFKVEAEYLGLNGNKIRLHKLNGFVIEVAIDKMSHEDVQMIKRHESRKARAAQMDEDDAPLSRDRDTPSRDRDRDASRRQASAATPSRSDETRGRAASPPIPAAEAEV